MLKIEVIVTSTGPFPTELHTKQVFSKKQINKYIKKTKQKQKQKRTLFFPLILAQNALQNSIPKVALGASTFLKSSFYNKGVHNVCFVNTCW